MKGIRAQLSHTHVAMTMTIMSTTSPPYISIMVVGMVEKLWIWFVILFLICYVFWIWDFLLLVILIFHFCISWFDYLLFLIVATFFGSCVFVFFAFSVQREVVIEKGRGSQIFSNPRRGSRFFFFNLRKGMWFVYVFHIWERCHHGGCVGVVFVGFHRCHHRGSCSGVTSIDPWWL